MIHGIHWSCNCVISIVLLVSCQSGIASTAAPTTTAALAASSSSDIFHRETSSSSDIFLGTAASDRLITEVVLSWGFYRLRSCSVFGFWYLALEVIAQKLGCKDQRSDCCLLLGPVFPIAATTICHSQRKIPGSETPPKKKTWRDTEITFASAELGAFSCA